ncbi:MAG: type 2 lantipeptide synthetase LanM family protein [Dolichospermum sp. BR01]|nr:type 2 lantipeptide synthetase LanM family protein [Dolichospermum sp. BR01]
MILTDSSTDIFKGIAIKASSLSECLNNFSDHGLIDNNLTEDEQIEIQNRLGFWCQIAAKGDEEKFQKRLTWDGLSKETVRLLVGKYANIESVILPPWLNTLKQVTEAAHKFSSQNSSELQAAIIPEKPIPFEDFYLPCLQVARKLLKDELKEQFEQYNKLLLGNVQAKLERRLLESLARIFAPTLMQEFGQFRTSGNALRDFLIISVQGASKRDKYQEFLQNFMGDGFLRLFEKYSVLGRLVAITIEFWVESTSELLKRLVTDWLVIQEHFSPHQSLNQVVDIAVGLSDGHKRGRTVAALTFDTGMKLIYKPKGIGLEVAFGNLLKWCNQQGLDLSFRFPEALDCSTHGWAEYIESLSCNTEDEVQRFYQRSGMLMCLIHVLKGTDCHYENLIASGEYPVLVDMETLLHPEIKNSELLARDISPLDQKLADSVLRTALLPMQGLSFANEIMSIDLSGLGKVEEQTVPNLTWQHINTDGMKLDYETINFAPETNVPTLDGVAVEPKKFINEIITGFEQMYHWVMEQREKLLSQNSPLTSFANQECRLVFRNTRIYETILLNSCSTDFMEVGMARSVGLDVLSRSFLTSSNKPNFWPILAAEKQQIEQLDIPMFNANTSSLDLHLAGTIIPHLFEKSSFDLVVENIQSLNETDLMFQIQVISLSLYSRFLEEPDLPPRDTITAPADLITSKDIITPDILLNEAINIARAFQQHLVKTADNSIDWLGIGYQHSSQNFYIQGSGLNLYDGSVGVSLFLAALAKATGDSQWRDLSITILNPLHQILERPTHDKLSQTLGVGEAEGMGYLIYGLVSIGKLLDEPGLLKTATEIATLISPEQITNDNIFDVVGGTAGTLLGLLSLLAATENLSSSPVWELAIACGEHLLNHQTGNKNEPRAWKTWRNSHLTGFSQGAAGISYALLRLYALTQNTRWLEAAKEAIAYEQTKFCPDVQNWLDLRSQESKFQVSWAQGAAGIALARLGGLSVLDTDNIRQQIAISLETTQKYMIWGVDSLCWGNFGRIETLLIAAQTLNCPNLLTSAHQATAIVLENARDQGKFTLSTQSFSPMNFGFFHGLSGIGYEILRLADPYQLPSVLLWQ